MIKGYDMDGVIAHIDTRLSKEEYFALSLEDRHHILANQTLQFKPTGSFYIITAREFIDYPITAIWLRDHGIEPIDLCCVGNKSSDIIAKDKSTAISFLHITEYWDDDYTIVQEMRKILGSTCAVNWVE